MIESADGHYITISSYNPPAGSLFKKNDLILKIQAMNDVPGFTSDI